MTDELESLRDQVADMAYLLNRIAAIVLGEGAKWTDDELIARLEALMATKVGQAQSSLIVQEIYDAYPRKVGRGAALKAIHKALKKVEPETLLAKVEEYRRAVYAWPKDELIFCPHPATWFNQERWMDDPAQWQRSGAKKAWAAN